MRESCWLLDPAGSSRLSPLALRLYSLVVGKRMRKREREEEEEEEEFPRVSALVNLTVAMSQQLFKEYHSNAAGPLVWLFVLAVCTWSILAISLLLFIYTLRFP